jgi:hypothetical protein
MMCAWSSGEESESLFLVCLHDSLGREKINRQKIDLSGLGSQVSGPGLGNPLTWDLTRPVFFLEPWPETRPDRGVRESHSVVWFIVIQNLYGPRLQATRLYNLLHYLPGGHVQVTGTGVRWRLLLSLYSKSGYKMERGNLSTYSDLFRVSPTYQLIWLILTVGNKEWGVCSQWNLLHTSFDLSYFLWMYVLVT